MATQIAWMREHMLGSPAPFVRQEPSDFFSKFKRRRQLFVSNTYPRISPSRKVQNINIVLPFVDQADTPESPKPRHTSTPIKDELPTEKEKQSSMNETFNLSPSPTFASKTLEKKESFKVRTVPVPNGPPISFFSSTLMEEDLESDLDAHPTPPRFINKRYRGKIYVINMTRARELIQQLKKVLFRENSRAIKTRENQSQMYHRSKNEAPFLSYEHEKKQEEEEVEEEDSCCDLNYSTLSNNWRKASGNRSTELQNILKDKKFNPGESFVKRIVAQLDKTKSFVREEQEFVHQNDESMSKKRPQAFVKMVVEALEDGRMSKAQEILSERQRCSDEESVSDCDVKSANSSVSISLKDTDSCSDSDRISSNFTDGENMSTPSPKNRGGKDDSVYWIPISRQTFPVDGYCQCCRNSWGKTYKKKNSRLFSIEETDSGCSDVYDASGVYSSVSQATLYV